MPSSESRVFHAIHKPRRFGEFAFAPTVMFAVVVLFTLAVTLAMSFHQNTVDTWRSFNQDTLATGYANLLVVPSTEARVFGNSKQNTSAYIRYGDYVEFLSSSVDFLFERSKPVDTRKAVHVSSRIRTPFVSHTGKRADFSLPLANGHPGATDQPGEAYIIGESSFLNAYHRRIDGLYASAPGRGATHLNLASIDTISKASFSADGSKEPELHGKLSLSTHRNGTMFEAMTLDGDSTHLRSDNVFLKSRLFIGDELYFRVHGEQTVSPDVAVSEHSLYLPLLGVTASRRESQDPAAGSTGQHRVNVASNATLGGEYTFHLGSADADHVNVLAAKSTVAGVYTRHGGQPQYKAITAFTGDGTLQFEPVYTRHGVRNLATDERLALDVVSLSDDQGERRAALDGVMGLRVQRYNLAEPTAMLGTLAPGPVVERGRVSVLAQHTESVFPGAVHTAAEKFAWPETRHAGSETGNVAETVLMYHGTGAVKTVDTDALLMRLVLAVQEQQHTIDQLRDRLAVREENV